MLAFPIRREVPVPPVSNTQPPTKQTIAVAPHERGEDLYECLSPFSIVDPPMKVVPDEQPNCARVSIASANAHGRADYRYGQLRA